MKLMCIDIETTGLDWTVDRIHGIGIGYTEDRLNTTDLAYYPAWHSLPENIILDLRNPEIPKLGQNLHAFDAKFIKRSGYDIQGEFHDTKVLANLFDPDMPLGLKYLADRFLGEGFLTGKHTLDEYIKDNKLKNIANMNKLDLDNPFHPHLDVIAEYCKEDVTNTIKLYWFFLDKLKKMDSVLKSEPFNFSKSPLDYYYDEALPLEKVLFDIEYRGIRVNAEYIHEIRNKSVKDMAVVEVRLNQLMSKRIPVVEKLVYDQQFNKASIKKRGKLVPGQDSCKFSWGNNHHVSELLYNHCGLTDEQKLYTDKRNYRMDKEAIDTLQSMFPGPHPLNRVLTLFLEYRKHAKIAQTYTGTSKVGILSRVRVDNKGHARIYPNFRQTTGTGRLACSNPNMQNLKRDSDVKKFFIPDNEDEVFDDADYSQIELRTGTHVSKDESLVTAYVTDQDVHLMTASRLFGREITKADDIERQAGKRTNFLTIFDGKAGRLQQCLKADTGKDFTINECKKFIRVWFETYPQVKQYLDEQLEFFKANKFCISETGRIRRLPDIVFGQYIEWKQIESEGQSKWIPTFFGPDKLRKRALDSWLSGDKRRTEAQASDLDISREAYYLYSHATKAGYNQPIQGLAASIMKRAIISLHNLGRTVANQVHDQAIVARKKGDLAAKQQVIDVMENIYKLCIPVKVDIKTLKSFNPKDKVTDE